MPQSNYAELAALYRYMADTLTWFDKMDQRIKELESGMPSIDVDVHSDVYLV
jgi:hypothetical protein